MTMGVKRLYWMLLAAVLCGSPAAAQSICFWTDDADAVPIRIYVDREYIGDVTAAFAEQPLIDTEGCLSVDTTPARHELTAVDKYGRVYQGWPGTIRPRTDRVNYLQIRAGHFQAVDRDDYDYVFVGWDPLFYLLDEPIRHHGYGRIVRDLDPLTDNGLLIGMGIAAVGATAAVGMAAARNWDIPDYRFPYVAVGLDSEYFSVLDEWRNVVRLKARFGNLGGVSLLTDMGVGLFPYRRSTSTTFTWSIGAGLDYGGFGFAVRYKPAIDASRDTFLVARLEYDWWVADSFAVCFHGGFGVGGYGEQALFEHYDFPFGIGFLIKL